MPGQRFFVAAGTYAVCRLPADASVPTWASAPGSFTSVTRTAEELSIVCEDARLPDPGYERLRREGGFALLRLRGPFPLDTVGVLASVAEPLAEAAISLFAVSTFDTDYILVKRIHLEQAIAVLTLAGHELVES